MYKNILQDIIKKYHLKRISIFLLLIMMVISSDFATTGIEDSGIASNAYLTANNMPASVDSPAVNRGQLTNRNRSVDKDIKDKEPVDYEFAQWLKKSVVVIDPGHGGNDYGACSKELSEKDISLDTSLRLGELLAKSGVNVIYTRKEDEYIGLYDRIGKANEVAADLFISVHVNSMENDSEINGSETLYFNSGRYDEGSLDSEKLALIVQKEMVEKLSTKDNGIIERPKLAVLRLAEMPAVIAELGYISNPSDTDKLGSEEYRQKAAQSLHDAVIEALRLKFDSK